MKSIINNDKVCFLCGTYVNIHKHHIFGAYNRNNSEKYGCWVYLCGPHHNLSDMGVHFNKQFDIELKQLAQTQFEKLHGHNKFMEVFSKNYL